MKTNFDQFENDRMIEDSMNLLISGIIVVVLIVNWLSK